MWTRFVLKMGLLMLLLVHFMFPAATVIGDIRIRSDDLFIFILIIGTLFAILMRSLKLTKLLAIDYLFIILMVLMAVSTMTSSHFINSLNAYMDYLRCFIAYFVFRTMLVNGIFSPKDGLRYLLWFGILLSIIGLVQYVTNSDFGFLLKYVGNDTANAYASTQGQDFVRIKGTIANPNIFGQWLVLTALPYTLLLALFKRQVYLKIIYLSIFIICFIALLLTVSRGVLIFGILTCFLALTYSYGTLRIFAISLFIIPAIIFSAILTDSGNISVIDNFSSRELVNNGDYLRIQYIGYGVSLLQNTKVIFLGTGLNALFPALVDYGIFTGDFKHWLDHTEISDAIHNAFLKIFVEAGTLAFIILTLFYIGIVRISVRIAAKSKDPIFKVFIAVIIGLFIPLNVYNSTMSYSVWLIVILLVAIESEVYACLESDKELFAIESTH